MLSGLLRQLGSFTLSLVSASQLTYIYICICIYTVRRHIRAMPGLPGLSRLAGLLGLLGLIDWTVTGIHPMITDASLYIYRVTMIIRVIRVTLCARLNSPAGAQLYMCILLYAFSIPEGQVFHTVSREEKTYRIACQQKRERERERDRDRDREMRYISIYMW